MLSPLAVAAIFPAMPAHAVRRSEFGGRCPVPKDRLVLAGLKAEAAVSGYHADNIAPALLGGFTIVRCRS